MLNRKIKKRIPFEEGQFYIMNHMKDRYLLVLKKNHFVMSAVSSLEEVENCLRTILNRYKSYDILMKAVKHCEHSLTEEQRKECENNFNRYGKAYADVVSDIIHEFYKGKAEKEKTKKILRKKRRAVFNSEPVENTTVEEVQEERPKTLLKRKKLLKKRISK